jgi:hypothetical protein
MIAREVKPREPRIKGVPTKMAIFDYNPGEYALYVGGSSLFNYRQGEWDGVKIPQPPGKVVDLAATNACLYVLVNADSPELYRLKRGMGEWTRISLAHTDFPRLQAVYGICDSEGKPNSDYLFVGAGRRNPSGNDANDYGVFYIDDNGGSLNPLHMDTGLLTGAAFDGGLYYFSTKGDGIYLTGGLLPSGSTASCRQITGKINARGMSRVGNMVLAFSYGGDILKVDGSGTIKLNAGSAGPYLRGSSAVWKNSGGEDTLLLVAVIAQDSSLGPTYGYREITIKTGPLATSTPGEMPLREPGNGTTVYPSTMDDNNRFKDTIESKPVNSIFQTPADVDPGMPLFASVQGTGTSQDDTDGGLWSYRVRDGIWQWNAE